MSRFGIGTPERAAMNRDLIWALLWGLTDEGLWAYVRDVYDAWLDGRSECGIIFEFDYIGTPEYFRRHLNWLVEEGRAEVSRMPGRHPAYRATLPSLPGEDAQ